MLCQSITKEFLGLVCWMHDTSSLIKMLILINFQVTICVREKTAVRFLCWLFSFRQESESGFIIIYEAWLATKSRMDKEAFSVELLERFDSAITALPFSWCRLFFPLIESDAGTLLWAAPLLLLSTYQHRFHQATRVKILSSHLKWYLLVIRGNNGKWHVCTLSCCYLVTSNSSLEGQRGNFLPHWSLK